VESPLQSWLTLQCRMVAGAEAALAVLGESERAPDAGVAHWPSPEQGTPRLSALVEVARRRGRIAVQEPAPAAGPSRALTHVALPITRGGRVAGAVGISLRGLAHAESKTVAERLAGGVRGLELLLDAQGERDRLAALLSLAAGLLTHEDLPQATHALAGELARELGCERMAVGLLRRGRLRVVALSTSARVDERRDAVRDVSAAMEEALDQDARLEHPAPPGAPPQGLRAHEQLARGSGAARVCTVPLAARGTAVGALTGEWSEADAPPADWRERLAAAAALTGPVLDLLERAAASPWARARAQAARLAERHLGADRSIAKWAAAAATALLLLLALAPADYRVSAPARLEGRVQRALVAAVPGYIAEANARAGDLVEAGEVLARLDDRDLRLEERRLRSEKVRLEKEYRQALATESRTDASIAAARVEQASARLELVREQLARTSVVAPFDGIVLEGDLDRSLGSPVEPGDVLFELAPLDGYRIIVEVDERDIADVEVGQRGRLALSALPGRRLPLVVERITPISTAEEGRNYFRVESALAQPGDSLRPGMEGIAKIEAGERRLLWIWTHGLFDWLRLRAWPWLP